MFAQGEITIDSACDCNLDIVIIGMSLHERREMKDGGDIVDKFFGTEKAR